LDGTVKLDFFGVTEQANHDQFTKATKQVLSDMAYYSPEYFLNKKCESKADIWSLGCVIFELCTLQKPFNSKNLSKAITHSEPDYENF
jgi:NIMA (never in mitosis gene a)-related kinase